MITAKPSPKTPDWSRILLGLIFLLPAVLVFLLVYFPETDTDLWWHLAAGRQMVRSHGLLWVDPFSTSSGGQAWTNGHWLFQLLVLLLYSAWGLAGLVAGKAFVCAGAAVLLVKIACDDLRQRLVVANPMSSSALQLLAVLIIVGTIAPARQLVLLRPVVLTLLGLSLFFWRLERYRRDRRWSSLIVLVPVQLVWTNIQPLGILGPAMVVCYFVGELLNARLAPWLWPGQSVPLARRELGHLAGAALLLLGVCWVTPYGWSAVTLPWRLLERIDTLGSDLFVYNISENVPPWILERLDPSPLALFKWVAALSFASFFVGLRRPLVLARLIMLSAFFGLALLANRNVLLFCWFAGALTVLNLLALLSPDHHGFDHQHNPRHLSGWPARGIVTLSVTALAFWITALLVAIHDQAPASEPAPFRVPTEAVAKLKASGITGPLFNSVRYGGYLAWQLDPQTKPYIDGRFILRTPGQFADYLALLDHPERFASFARQHHLHTVLLPTAFPDRYRPLVCWLYRQKEWRLIYTDGTQTLFVRSRPGSPTALDLSSARVEQSILSELQRRYQHQPLVLQTARVHLGQLLAELGYWPQAAHLLQQTDGPAAEALLARTYYGAGQLEQAAKQAQAILTQRPDDPNSLNLLGLVALQQGDPRRAIRLLTESLQRDPYNEEARQLLTRIKQEAQSGHN
jgi:hypothetical protein